MGARREGHRGAAVNFSAFLWEEIARDIKTDADRQATKDLIIATLRRQEAVIIPGEVQLYVAKLLAGEIVGRPKLTSTQRALAAIDLIERVDEMAAGKTLEAAFDEVARTSGLTAKTIKRKYRAGVKELRSWPEFRAFHSMRRPARRNGAEN